MFLIDDTNLLQEALNNPAIHHMDDMKGQRSLLLDGKEVTRILYINEERGFLIRIKTDIQDKPIICNDGLVHEILFGNIEVKQN